MFAFQYVAMMKPSDQKQLKVVKDLLADSPRPHPSLREEELRQVLEASNHEGTLLAALFSGCT